MRLEQEVVSTGGVETTTKRKRGRSKRTWLEKINSDLKICNSIQKIALYHAEW